MAEETAFENRRISNIQGLVTLTLERVVLYTAMHHSMTTTYMPNFTEIEETFCGRVYARTYVHTDGQTYETHFIRSTQKCQPKTYNNHTQYKSEQPPQPPPHKATLIQLPKYIQPPNKHCTFYTVL